MRRALPLLLLPLLAGCSLLSRRAVETPEEVRVRTERDLVIQREVEARLAAEPSIGPGRVRVTSLRGDVSLHGGVIGYGAQRCALRNAELTAGVRLVIDFLVVEPGPSTVPCLAPRAFDAGA